MTVENPPPNFDCDLSTNVSLILAKLNKLNPQQLSENIKYLLLKNIKDFEDVNSAGPGFINIRLSNKAIYSIINNIIRKKDTYGSQKNKNSYNIEFVSANPTGPMHIGHCRGAIFGDVLSNLLKFNGNKVTKEYYINDYGSQIKNFVKSVFLRIREIKYQEKFLDQKDLYPGEYIKDIAKEILIKNKSSFNNFENNYNFLEKMSLKYSMASIKKDLEKLGIKHDIFISEKSIVKANTVTKAINQLKKTNHVEDGYLDPPKGEEKKLEKNKKINF